MDRQAEFSKNKKERFLLSRTWGEGPMIMFIGINPSTADGETDDNTVRRLIGFTKDWGYSGFCLTNIYPHIATKFKDCNKRVTGVNLIFIRDSGMGCEKIIAMWGNRTIDSYTQEYLKKWFPKMYCFGKNANGTPKHPLYLSKDTQLIKYF